MAQRGWTVPHWPKKYGGGGLNSLEHKILQDEMKRINARIPLQSFGIWMLGPALLEFATGKLHYLRKSLKVKSAGVRVTQSQQQFNLAGLQTRAEDKGDHFLVNGAKIWTSWRINRTGFFA